MLARLLTWIIRIVPFSDKSRLELVNGLINRAGGVPIHSIITVDENRRILVQGKALSVEDILRMRESARTLLDSPLRKLIQQQVRFSAIDEGYLKSQDPTKTALFYKAAIWFSQQEDELLRGLAQDPTLS